MYIYTYLWCVSGQVSCGTGSSISISTIRLYRLYLLIYTHTHQQFATYNY